MKARSPPLRGYGRTGDAPTDTGPLAGPAILYAPRGGPNGMDDEDRELLHELKLLAKR